VLVFILKQLLTKNLEIPSAVLDNITDFQHAPSLIFAPGLAWQ
jgi:hypothetical protein